MLNYRIIGKGKPLVFLHGFLESMSMWEFFPLEDLPFQCVLLDLPGHGSSEFRNQDCSIVHFAKEVKATLDQLEIRDYALIGHSLGGYVALELHRSTASGEKICLFHSNFWEDGQQKKCDRDRVIAIVKTNRELFVREAIPGLFLDPESNREAMDKLLEEALQIPADVIACCSMAMRDRKSCEEYVMGLGDRILIVQGEQDKIVPVDRMIKYLGQVGVEVIPGAGHMGHIEAGQLTFRKIKKFFN